MTSARSSKGPYSHYYEKLGEDRNDLLRNPEVLFQSFAIDRANIAALRSLSLDKRSSRVLDVGCGSGSGLLQFVRLGFSPANLVGIDLNDARIEEGKALLPGIDLQVADASRMPLENASFDLVFESTMLGTLESQSLLASIAKEMIRVTRPGGYIMLADWRYSRKGSGVKTAISRAKIAELFSVGSGTEVVARQRGALVPPLGRRLSRLAPSIYFLVQGMLPFAAGQVTTVLRKSS